MPFRQGSGSVFVCYVWHEVSVLLVENPEDCDDSVMIRDIKCQINRADALPYEK